MEVTILGCSFSLGVPVIGCNCAVCLSNVKYNKRSRSAIFIKSEQAKILVDFGADIRNQLLSNNITELDAVICTHDHADHVAGIDDLRAFYYLTSTSLPIYTDVITAQYLQTRYTYLFKSLTEVRPFITTSTIDFYQRITIKDVDIQFFKQIHGINTSLGFRINNFVYSNDLTDFPPESKSYLEGIDHWVLDCIDYQHTHAHCGLEEVLTWHQEFKPKNIYLTNLSHKLDYDILKSQLPAGITPCYDNMVIKI